MSRLFFNLIKINMSETKKDIISISKMEWWYDHVDKYEIDKIAKSIKSEDAYEHYKLLAIEKKKRTKKEKLKEVEFYVKGYAYLYEIPEEEVIKMDFLEVKEKIMIFRRDYE